MSLLYGGMSRVSPNEEMNRWAPASVAYSPICSSKTRRATSTSRSGPASVSLIVPPLDYHATASGLIVAALPPYSAEEDGTLLHTRICELLGVEHPILNAPMSSAAGVDLAAA